MVRQVVLDHVETFFEEARRRGGSGVPEFVRRAFYKMVDCGCLAKGFARFRCSSCGFDRLVPFSCKIRQLCSSCSARRMMALSAHLVDSVFPEVPVRQWVLTLPYPLRYEVAWNHGRQKEVLALFMEALSEFYRNAARAQGITDGRTGAVTVVQRVGSALNLNPHYHVAAIDGVFSRSCAGKLEFNPLLQLTDEDVAQLVATVRQRVLAMLQREGVDDSHGGFLFDPLQDESPSLAGIYSASVQGRVAMGRRAGRRVLRVGAEPNAPWVTSRTPLQAHVQGFDLHAAVAVEAGDRERLERLCRYLLRPPVVEDRLELQDDGRISLELKTPYWDGTTHILFEPLEFLEKLATLVPRPRTNQLLYHGLLAPNAAWRKEVVRYRARVPMEGEAEQPPSEQSDEQKPPPRPKSYTWAELMARAFLMDVLNCPRCGGRLQLIALIDQPSVIYKILNHLGLPTTVASPSPARSPPRPEEGDLPYVEYFN